MTDYFSKKAACLWSTCETVDQKSRKSLYSNKNNFG